jgi:hypothetical protein
VAPFRRRQSKSDEKSPWFKFDRDLYELARRAAGPDTAAGVTTLPDAIRLLGTRAADRERAIQDAALKDGGEGIPYELIRREYPQVYQAELFLADAVSRLVVFSALSDDPAAGPGPALAGVATSSVSTRQSLAMIDNEGQFPMLCLDMAILGHVFYRSGDLANAIPVGQKAGELVLKLIEMQHPRPRPILVLAIDVLIFNRVATGEIPLARQGLEQALVHLEELASEGAKVGTALSFHRQLRAAL